MKIPSLPKGASGFPIVIVLIAVGIMWYRNQNKKGWWLWKITEIDTNEKQLNNQKRKLRVRKMVKKTANKLTKLGLPTAYVSGTAILVTLICQHLSVCD